MSGAAVVIIVGGGNQQSRTADEAEPEIIKVRVTRHDREAIGDALRRAADVLDGQS